MKHVNSIVRWSLNNLRMVESGIDQKEKDLIVLTTDLVNLKVAEQLANDGERKKLAIQRRVDHERKQHQAEQSLIEEKLRQAKLKLYYQAISAEASAVQQQLATPESQERYFAGIQSRKTHNDDETFLKFLLSDFHKNNDCIRQLDGLIKDVGSNLEQIGNVVKENWRHQMSALFDASSRKVNLFLCYKLHVIELSHYLHHLKEGTRKSDIERIEECISKICSNLSKWTASLSCLDPRVEPDLSQIRDTVKLYWRASFDVSTKKVCLTHPDEKVEHLDIPDYIKYLTRRIEHFEEILAEKKRMCK